MQSRTLIAAADDDPSACTYSFQTTVQCHVSVTFRQQAHVKNSALGQKCLGSELRSVCSLSPYTERSPDH